MSMSKRKHHTPVEEETHPVAKKMMVVEEVAPEAPSVESSEAPSEVEAQKIEEAPSVSETLAESSAPVENTTPVTPIPVEVVPESYEENKSSYLWIIIPVALLVGAFVGGLITYFSGISKLNEPEVIPSPLPSVESVASPSPSPVASTVKREDFKLQVLNGSGVSGLAGKAKMYLEGLGYKSVAVGNANVSNLTETKIAVKGKNDEALALLKADLAKNYTVAAEIDTLPASSPYDFVITLGSK